MRWTSPMASAPRSAAGVGARLLLPLLLAAPLLLGGCGTKTPEANPRRPAQAPVRLQAADVPRTDPKPVPVAKAAAKPRPRSTRKRNLELALKPAQTGAIIDLSKSAVATLLEARLLSQPKLAWVERTHIDRVLQEQELQAAFGAESAAQRVRLGKLLKADLMILLRPGKKTENRLAAQLDVVIFETQWGLRLWSQAFALTNNAETDAIELEKIVNQAIAKQGERISDVCAVPLFVSNDLEYRFDYLKAAFAEALGQHLQGREGVLLVEFAEARAISKEVALADAGAALERRLPVYFLGEYRGSGTERDRRLSITLKLLRGQKEIGAGSRSGLSLSEAPQALCALADELADKVLATAPATSDPDTEAGQLNQRAAMLQKFGAWEDSLALLEASLLLKPDQPETRQRAITACVWMIKKDKFQSKTDPQAAYAMLRTYRRALEHHESLLRPTKPADPPWRPDMDKKGVHGMFAPTDLPIATSEVWTYYPPTAELAALQQEVLQEERASMIRLARWRGHAQYGDEFFYIHKATYAGWPMAERVATTRELILEFQDLPWPKERTLRILRWGWPAIGGYMPPEKVAMVENLTKEGNDGVKEAARAVLAEFHAWQQKLPALRASVAANIAREKAAAKQKAQAIEKPLSDEVDFRPVELIWQDPKGKLIKIPRITGCVPIREGLDVIVVDRAVFLMKDKGRLRLVWNGPGYPSSACYDGRWVWFRSGESVWNAQNLFVLDPESGKFWTITARQGLPVADRKDLPDILMFQSIAITPLGPGKVLLAGAFGRTWIAIATFSPLKATVSVFHEAKELQTAEHEEQGKHTAVAFAPTAMYTLKSNPGPDGHVDQRVIIARRQLQQPLSNWPPLVVDPEKLTVEVAPKEIFPNALHESTSHDGVVYGCTDQKYRKEGYRFYRLLYPDTLEVLSTTFPVHGQVVLVGDRLNLIADQWWTGSLARREIHPVRALPPEITGVFPSAHYGLLFSSYDRSQKKHTNYQVVFKNAS